MKNFIQVGLTLTCTAVAAVVSGMVTMIGAMPVVPMINAEIGEVFEGQTQGVFSFPKTLANTPAQGAKAYLLADGTAVTTTATSNTLIGVFTEARLNGDTHAPVRLNGVSV